jgi:hypothetical protein
MGNRPVGIPLNTVNTPFQSIIPFMGISPLHKMPSPLRSLPQRSIHSCCSSSVLSPAERAHADDLYKARITGIGASKERRKVQEQELSKYRAPHAKVGEHVTHNTYDRCWNSGYG